MSIGGVIAAGVSKSKGFCVQTLSNCRVGRQNIITKNKRRRKRKRKKSVLSGWVFVVVPPCPACVCGLLGAAFGLGLGHWNGLEVSPRVLKHGRFVILIHIVRASLPAVRRGCPWRTLISAVCSGTLIRRVSVSRTTVRSARCLSRGFAVIHPATTASITAKLSGLGVCPRRAAVRPESGSIRPVWESPGRRGKPATPWPVQSVRRGPKSSASRPSCWMRRSEMLSLHFGYRNSFNFQKRFIR